MNENVGTPPETLPPGLQILDRGVERLATGELERDAELVEQIRAVLRRRGSHLARQRTMNRSLLGRMEQRLWNFLVLPLPLPGQWHFPLTGWMFVLLGAVIWLLVAPLMLLLLAAVLIPFVAWMFWSDARGRTRFAAAQVPRCRRCGYDMAGAPDALPPALVGAGSGPRRCPECGVP